MTEEARHFLDEVPAALRRDPLIGPLHAALAAVLREHAVDPVNGVCTSADHIEDDGYRVVWPCQTVDVINEAVRLER